MNRSNNFIYLRHSPLLSIPFVGGFLYAIQLLFLKLKWSNVVYVSRKESRLRKMTLKILSKKEKVFCQTYKLGRTLESIKTTVVFDYSSIDTKKLSKLYLYQLMWTLVFCASVNVTCKKALGSLLPKEFPIFDVNA